MERDDDRQPSPPGVRYEMRRRDLAALGSAARRVQRGSSETDLQALVAQLRAALDAVGGADSITENDLARYARMIQLAHRPANGGRGALRAQLAIYRIALEPLRRLVPHTEQRLSWLTPPPGRYWADPKFGDIQIQQAGSAPQLLQRIAAEAGSGHGTIQFPAWLTLAEPSDRAAPVLVMAGQAVLGTMIGNGTDAARRAVRHAHRQHSTVWVHAILWTASDRLKLQLVPEGPVRWPTWRNSRATIAATAVEATVLGASIYGASTTHAAARSALLLIAVLSGALLLYTVAISLIAGRVLRSLADRLGNRPSNDL